MTKKKVKVVAFYLPQYYTFKENDEWWGEGFTEWVNVKKANQLFDWQYQPQKPLNDFYYELNNNHHNTMEKQIDIAKKYGVYGFCFYHYWFQNGKRLLDIPVDKFLQDKSLDISFCLSWANEPWTRAWDGGNKEIIMPQEYGDKDEWKEHFYYLLPFFKDDRYIKNDGKPIFIIYRPELIDQMEQMLDLWTELALKEGLNGIDFWAQGSVYGTTNDTSKRIKKQIMYEPGFTQGSFSVRRANQIEKFREDPKLYFNVLLQKIKTQTAYKLRIKGAWWNTTILSYDYVWNNILSRKYKSDDIIPGAFTDWDNSPRRGDGGARVFKGGSPEKFHIYFRELVKKIIAETNQDMIFITAWNEWAEGAHLEPDDKHKYGYLEAIKEATDLK